METDTESVIIAPFSKNEKGKPMAIDILGRIPVSELVIAYKYLLCVLVDLSTDEEDVKRSGPTNALWASTYDLGVIYTLPNAGLFLQCVSRYLYITGADQVSKRKNS